MHINSVKNILYREMEKQRKREREKEINSLRWSKNYNGKSNNNY